MAKVHKSLRIEQALADRVRAAMAEGETETAAYARVIETGLDALEARAKPDAAEDAASGKQEGTKEQTAAEGRPTPGERRGNGETEVLRDYVATLKDANARLTEQMAVKDEQIAALTRITEQSQALHAITEHKGTMALESETGKEKRRGLFSRLFG